MFSNSISKKTTVIPSTQPLIHQDIPTPEEQQDILTPANQQTQRTLSPSEVNFMTRILDHDRVDRSAAIQYHSVASYFPSISEGHNIACSNELSTFLSSRPSPENITSHLLNRQTRSKIFDLLETNGIDPNACSANGSTALMHLSQCPDELATEIDRDNITNLFQVFSGQIAINLQNSKGSSALLIASQYGYQPMLNLLLHESTIEVNLQNTEGYTALMIAAVNRHASVIHMLSQHPETDANIKNKQGRNALMLAVLNNDPETVTALLACKNIDINATDPEGNTPLILASIMGYEEIVQILCSQRADTRLTVDRYAQNSIGWNALDFAKHNNHLGIADIITRFKANNPTTYRIFC